MNQDQLYYVVNSGCDDWTRGLVRISDEDFPNVKAFIENLNKNSTYGCMPTIAVYKVDMDLFRKKTDDDTCEENWLYMDGEVYVLRDRFDYDGRERVI